MEVAEMKIEAGFSAVLNSKQAKSTKESKPLELRKTGSGVEDDVSVAAQTYSSQAAPAASYNEALDLTKRIDYRGAMDAFNIPGDMAFQLAGLARA
jgi:TolA-binding protein